MRDRYLKNLKEMKVKLSGKKKKMKKVIFLP